MGLTVKRTAVLSIVIVSVVLFIIWGMSFQHKEQRIVLQQEVTVVDIKGEQKILGTLAANTMIWLDDVQQCDEEWCTVIWGDMTAKFEMTEQVVIEKVKEREEIASQEATETIQIARDTIVHNAQQPIGTIVANQTFPAISFTDEVAIIQLANGLGEVALSDTMTTTATQLSEAIEVTKDTTIYQFDQYERRYAIGTLYAGEAFEVIETMRYYYVIQFGNGEAYVPREHTQPATQHMVEALYLKSEATGSIMANEPLTVHTSMATNAPVLAVLEPEMRYVSVGQWQEWAIVRIGGRVGYVQADTTHEDGIPVLHYEHIIPSKDVDTFPATHTVTTLEQFIEQMTYLATEGYMTVSKDNVLDYIDGSYVLPRKAVLVTFDGGLLSAKEYAYPVLQERGFQAVQHIIASRLDRAEGEQSFSLTEEQFMTLKDINMTKDVFDMEAQTFNLVGVAEEKSIFVQLPIEIVKDDLRQLVNELGTVTSFAYPHGQTSEQVVKALQEYGFLMAFTREARDIVVGDNAMLLPRYSITTETTFDMFKEIVAPQQ